MSRRVWIAVAAVAVLAACRSEEPIAIPAGGGAPARRVVLLSIDGLAAVRQDELLARGAYHDAEGLAAFAARGFVVDRAIAVNPTLTAVSHASIATGAFPAVTGIVSNAFHLPGTPISQSVSGFAAPWHAEPLWAAFRRQGRRVGVLAFPGCDGTAPQRAADFGTAFPAAPFAHPREVALSAREFAPVPAGGAAAPEQCGSPRLATVAVKLSGGDVPPTATFYLTACTAPGGGPPTYTSLVVDDDPDPADGTLARVRPGEWFPLQLVTPDPDGGSRLVGSWCLLQDLDPGLDRVRFYQGSFNATRAYPRSFRERLDRDAGFWPGPADDRALERGLAGEGGLSVSEYLAQVRRFSAYLSSCAASAVAHERFDLLMAYQPVVDEVEHALLVTGPRQRDYSPGLAATAGDAVDAGYAVADRAVGDLARQLDLRRDALVVVSDHGMAPLWEQVHVNEVLRRAGLATADSSGRYPVPGAASKMVAFCSGGCAQLYVNLEGREPTGVVPPARRDEVVRAAASALAALEVDGVPAVERMFRRDELGPLGLEAPEAGDLVAFMTPGFAADGRIGGSEHEPAAYAGQHGYLDTHGELAAIWVARGAAVPRKRVATRSLTLVAAFVSALAGVDPPRNAQPWPR